MSKELNENAVFFFTAVMAGWLVSSSQNHCTRQYWSTLGNEVRLDPVSDLASVPRSGVCGTLRMLRWQSTCHSLYFLATLAGTLSEKAFAAAFALSVCSRAWALILLTKCCRQILGAQVKLRMNRIHTGIVQSDRWGYSGNSAQICET